jgi:hypothetical protein
VPNRCDAGSFAQQRLVAVTVRAHRVTAGPVGGATSAGGRAKVRSIWNPDISRGALRGFVESNGWVSMNAANLTHAVNWRKLDSAPHRDRLAPTAAAIGQSPRLMIRTAGRRARRARRPRG